MEVKIKGIKELEESLVTYLQKITDDADVKKAIGDQAVKYIKGSIQTGGDGYEQPNVGHAWADKRAELANTNTTSQFYPGSIKKVGPTVHKTFTNSKGKKAGLVSESESRLTFTGQLLDSLSFESILNGIKFVFTGDHTPYRGKSGKPQGKTVPNAKIAEGLESTRKIVSINGNIKKQLETIIVREVRRKISLYQKLSKKVSQKTEA